MKHVRVRITAHGHEAAIHPMYDVLANAEFVERATALQWNYTGEALGILHYVVGDVAALETALEAVPEVVGYDLERIDDGSCYAYVRDETTARLRALLAPSTGGSLVVVPPVTYNPDGTVAFSMFGPEAELQAIVDQVPAPVEVTVEAVGGLAGIAPAIETQLTERQREVAETAVELGYYDVPRSATQDDVASELDCAPSTAAEHLRKAESRVLRAQLGR